MIAAGEQYLEALRGLLTVVSEQEIDAVRAAGEAVGTSVAADGIVHTFGSGHSHLVAEEIFIRAGTLTTVRSIWPDHRTDRFERVPGLGASIVDKGDVRSEDV